MLNVCFVGLGCGQEGFGGMRRLPFPYTEPLAGGNPASTCLCTSPCSEGCAVSEQELQGLQEGAGASPELALWGLPLHKFNVQLEG